jgi:hypothetical protein
MDDRNLPIFTDVTKASRGDDAGHRPTRGLTVANKAAENIELFAQRQARAIRIGKIVEPNLRDCPLQDLGHREQVTDRKRSIFSLRCRNFLQGVERKAMLRENGDHLIEQVRRRKDSDTGLRIE